MITFLFWNLGMNRKAVQLDAAFQNRLLQRDNLRILTTDGTIRYLDENGIPDKELASDHLPLMIRLEL